MAQQPPTAPGRTQREVSERLVTAALTIYARGRASAAELAALLNTTPRAVYRLTSRLHQLQLPITADPGPGGGFFYDYTSVPASGSPVDLLPGLFIAAGLVDVLTAKRTEPADLLARLPQLEPTDRQRVLALSERILLDTEDWYSHDRPGRRFDQLREAVIADRQVTVSYTERDGTPIDSDLLDPHALIWKAGIWYVYGYSHTHQQRRRIRLSRINDLAPAAATFTREPGVDLLGQWRTDLADFGSGDTTVLLRINPSAYAEFAGFGWKPDTIITQHDDHQLAELHVDRYDWLVPLISSFTGEVIALQPEDLREQAATAAHRLLSAHTGQDTSASVPAAAGDVRARAAEFRLTSFDS